MSENKTFSEQISNRLNVAAKKLVADVVKEIFAKIKKHADDPVAWPLSIKDETKSIVDCQRAVDIMVEILDSYGISYMDGADFAVIDIIDPEYDDVEDDERSEIMTAECALELSNNNMLNKLLDTYSFVSEKIKNAAHNSDYKIIVSTAGEPIRGDAVIIKRLVKN